MGPLQGFRFLEFAGLGPTQHAGMLLADMGAEVVRIVRTGDVDVLPIPERCNVMNRSRRSLALDLKHTEAAEVVLRLVESADALYEGFRPGVMERLGLGPEICRDRNRRLVYARMTGWGQDGPLADAVGHDPNYVALSGALHAIGTADAPTIPLNLVGDFGGGSLYLVSGLLAALLETSRSGEGQVVDVAMVDGAASLMATFYGLTSAGLWADQREANLLDGGAHFHHVYRTKDDRHVVVAAIEPQFHKTLLERLGIDPEEARDYLSPARWPALREKLEKIFQTRTLVDWIDELEGTEACVSPVLSLSEAPLHRHNEARGTFVSVDGIVQPAPAPRFDRTPSTIRNPPPARGLDTRPVLAEHGFSDQEIDDLIASGAVEEKQP